MKNEGRDEKREKGKNLTKRNCNRVKVRLGHGGAWEGQ
jgi:hypothetical protein